MGSGGEGVAGSGPCGKFFRDFLISWERGTRMVDDLR